MLPRCILVAIATVGCATGAAERDKATATAAPSRDDVIVTYLGNEAVLVAHGSTRVLVDALYFDWADAFRVVPIELKRRIFTGEAPVDGITAILVTHIHGDHFFTRDLLHYLDRQPTGRVFLPRQAYDKLAAEPSARPESLARATPIDAGTSPTELTVGGLHLDAITIPHVDIGRPNEPMEHVAYRVTLDGVATFTHLGDAAPARAVFDAWWRAHPSDLVLAPFWFFTEGNVDLARDVAARAAMGFHVWPVVPTELRGKAVDLFLETGESCVVRRDARPPARGQRICGLGSIK